MAYEKSLGWCRDLWGIEGAGFLGYKFTAVHAAIVAR